MLPALGESVTEGTVTRWLKNVGDEIAMDEPLLEISTDKVDTEVPSPVAGTLLEIRAAEDETVEVGAVLAVIGAAGSAPAAAPEAAPHLPPRKHRLRQPPPNRHLLPRARRRGPAPPAPEPTPAPAPLRGSRAGTRPRPEATDTYVTPIVRKLAKQHGVDLEKPHRHRRRRSHPQAGCAGCRIQGAGRIGTGWRRARCRSCARGTVAAARPDREDHPAAQHDRDPHGPVAAGFGAADAGARG